jgi:hypothetical protein
MDYTPTGVRSSGCLEKATYSVDEADCKVQTLMLLMIIFSSLKFYGLPWWGKRWKMF